LKRACVGDAGSGEEVRAVGSSAIEKMMPHRMKSEVLVGSPSGTRYCPAIVPTIVVMT
jgi:hypothetical protein